MYTVNSANARKSKFPKQFKPQWQMAGCDNYSYNWWSKLQRSYSTQQYTNWQLWIKLLSKITAHKIDNNASKILTYPACWHSKDLFYFSCGIKWPFLMFRVNCCLSSRVSPPHAWMSDLIPFYPSLDLPFPLSPNNIGFFNTDDFSVIHIFCRVVTCNAWVYVYAFFSG